MLHRIVVAVVLLLVCEAVAETPLIIPRPHVVVVLNGTYTTSPDVITFACSEVYMNDFRNSFEITVGRANDAIERGQLCVGSLANGIPGDVSQTVSGSVARVDFGTAVFPSDSNSIRGAEICSYDVQGFLQTFSNWPQPIIPGYGCPPVTFTPEAFDWVKSEWGCLS